MKFTVEHEEWEKLRKRHREHLEKLGPIKCEVEKYIVTKPLSLTEQPILHNGKDMKKAFDDLNNWETEERKITEEYSKFE